MARVIARWNVRSPLREVMTECGAVIVVIVAFSPRCPPGVAEIAPASCARQARTRLPLRVRRPAHEALRTRGDAAADGTMIARLASSSRRLAMTTPAPDLPPSRRPQRRPPRSLARVLCAVLPALTLGACATNPVSGKRELALISAQQEVQIGQQAAQEAAQSMGVVEDAGLQQYVSTLGKQLAAKSERPELPWSFTVVDDPTPNAFALPGGPIFVTRGLLAIMTSEAQLASVIGHEIGHVTARHSVNQMSKQQLAQLGLGLGAILVPGGDQLAGLASQGLGLLFLKYGRDDERQADELGFRYSLEQGYDVREMAKVFQALQQASALEGARKIPDWAASHPAEPERIANVQKRVAALGPNYRPGRVGTAEFMQQVDGLTYGENPRSGFFRDGTFYHPEMKFRFTVPADWQTQNASSAVAALSPRKDAMVQLTLAPKGASPEQATQQFSQQQGLQVGQSSRQTFNGVPSVITPFQAQTQQGVLQGYVAFMSYGGQTFQLVTYAPAQAFQTNERVFADVIKSFGPLTDPKILGVQAPKLQVVKLDRPTTLAQLARQGGSNVPVERLAVLNQVQDPNATLPAGTFVKRVVGDVPK
jgi:predicted Zn-dependent protease